MSLPTMDHIFFDSASYSFSIFSLPVLVIGALSLGLGVATLIRENRSGPSIAFLAMQTAVASWLLTYAVIYSTTNAETARIWLQVLGVGLVWIPVGVLAFAIAISESWRRLWPLVAATSIISGAFAVLGLINNNLFVEEVRDFFWGYYSIAGPGTTLYALYQTSCLIGAAAILWQAQRATQSVIRRRRLQAILFALMVSYLGGVDFLPTSGIEVYPFGYAFIGVFVVLATRAIWRYRLVDLTPELAAPQIIETMSEALLVVDPDGIIRVANDAAGEMFNDGKGGLLGSGLEELTSGRVRDIISIQDDGDVNELEFGYERNGVERTVIVSSRDLTNTDGDFLGTIHIGHDITERKEAEEGIARSEALYRTLFETSPDAVILTDPTGVIVMANQGAASLLRVGTPDELIGRPAAEFVTEADRERLSAALASISESNVLRSDEYSLVVADGSTVPIELSLSRVRARDDEVDGFLAVARDISERKRAQDTIQHLAYHDSLTGLANRSLLLERLAGAISATAEGGGQVAVLYMDLDGLKAINDTFGHTSGDEVLEMVGKRLGRIIREEDSLARIGGDEFVIVIPTVHSEDQVTMIAERVLDAVRKPFVVSTDECNLSVSIGIALYPDDASSVDALLDKADAAMYGAKALGGNSYLRSTADGDLARAV